MESRLPVDIMILPKVEPLSDSDLRSFFSVFILHRWRSMQVAVSKYYHMREFLNVVSELSFFAAPQLFQMYHESEAEGLEILAYHTVQEYPTPFGGSTPSLTACLSY